MRSILLLGLLAGLTVAEYAWKPDLEYRYFVQSRTLTGIHQVANQFAGLFMRYNVSIVPINETAVSVKVFNGQFARLHANLSGGVETFVSDNNLEYSPIPLLEKAFELVFNEGVVDKIVVDEEVPTWQVNLYKSIASQFQVDITGRNLDKWDLNYLPTEEKLQGNYRTVEDSVTGKCMTIYDVSPLPLFMLQSRPELAPLAHLRGDGHLIDIVKTQNYSDCHQRMSYHFGVTGYTPWDVASNKMGQFLSRTNIVRAVIAGSLRQFTIQSSVATNEIIVSPHFYNNQKGVVFSRLNLTVIDVMPKQSEPERVQSPRTIDNLVYEYNPAKSSESQEVHGQARSQNNKDSSSSSSSSSSSEEFFDFKNHPFRQDINKNDSSSSSRSSSSRGRRRGSSSSDSSSSSSRGHRRGSSSSSSDSRSSSSQSSSSSSGSQSSSGSSSSSSSSEEYSFYQPRPLASSPAQSSLLPLFIGFEGNSVQANKKIDFVQVVKALVGEIAGKWDPENIVARNTMSRLSLVTNLLRTMSYDQMMQLTNEFYSTSRSNLKWKVFRDTVAQTGAGPALLAITQWVKDRKLEGEDAAEVLAVLPNSVRYPTPEYMNTFYDLVKAPEVKDQLFVNSSGILSFSTLVRRVFVSKADARRRYPIHTFGRISANDSPVIKLYVPYLEEELRSAVKEGSSHKIQVYTRALGNIAHPEIIRVFKPYLEGKVTVTQYQRFFMVASLDYLTKTYPKYALSVLYSVYRNTGESPDIRGAAVMHIMKASPPAQLLQRMAMFTNQDPSEQVSSIVKSAIETAASLRTPQSYYLSQNALSAVNLLNPKVYENYKSKHLIKAFLVKGHPLGYKQDLTLIQSEDSILPSSFFYYLRRQMGGYKLPYKKISFSSSSFRNFITALWSQVQGNMDFNSNSQYKNLYSNSQSSDWTSNKIAEILNITVDKPKEVEFGMNYGFLGGERFFAFGMDSIEQIPSYIRELYKDLKTGKDYSKSKFYNQFSMDLAFPTVTGLPFVYSIDIPTEFYLKSNVRAKISPEDAFGGTGPLGVPDSMQASTKVQFLYSLRTQSRLGFVVPFTHQHFVAGLDKNTHFYIPVNMLHQVDFEKNNIAVKADLTGDNESQIKLFEYSSNLFTTVYNVFDFKPIQETSEKMDIHAALRTSEKINLHPYGVPYEINIQSENRHPVFTDFFERNDLMTAWLYPYAESSLKNNRITINTVPHSASYFLHFDTPMDTNKTVEKTEEKGKMIGDNLVMKKGQPQSVEDFLNVKSYLRFTGPFDSVHQTVFNLSRSVAPSHWLAYWYQRHSVDGTPVFEGHARTGYKPPSYPLNFKAVATKDVEGKMKLDSAVQFMGARTMFNASGHFQRTEERRNYVLDSDGTKQCIRQMQEGNLISPACMNSTFEALMMNEFIFEIRDHDGISSANVTFSPDFDSVYFENLPYEYMNQKLSRLGSELGRIAKRMMDPRPYYWGSMCSLDDSSVTTFDNKTYPVNLGPCWHAVMQTMTVHGANISVLARNRGDQLREVKLLFGDVSVGFIPGREPFVLVNNEEVKVQESVVDIFDKMGRKLFFVYYAENTIRLFSYRYGIGVIYDGDRVVLFATERYRGQTYGLCGTYTTETVTDFSTPDCCVLQNPFEFASTYAIIDDSCQGRAPEMRKRINASECYTKDPIFSVLPELGNVEKKKKTEKPKKVVSDKATIQCFDHQAKYMTEDKKTCFTIRPQMVCLKGCKPSSSKLKPVDFHCMVDSKSTRYWVDVIKNGGKPDFSSLPVHKQVNMMLPEKCIKV